MKTKLFASICVAIALAVTYTLAQDQNKTTPAPRVDKLLEQNEQKLKDQQEFLKGQQDILQRLDKIDEQLLGVRRRAGSRIKPKKVVP